MAAWLAAGLGAVLVASAAAGRGALGSAVALGLVLTAVPALPTAWRPGVAILAIRGSAVLTGALVAIAAAAQPVALAAVTVLAAVAGALLRRVGPTLGLAVVLVAVDAPAGGAPLAAVLPYVGGVAVAAVCWAAWYACDRLRGASSHEGTATASAPGHTGRHAVTVGSTVACAVLAAHLLPDGLVGGHWLITSVLLTVQPVAADTGVRLAQRLLGNTLGAVIAAAVLGARPALVVVAALAVTLFTLAMALRPVNYTWWAVTGPPVLLVVSEYPHLFPWYEGGIRLAMNLGGAIVVLLVVFGVPALWRSIFRRSAVDYRESFASDTVYEMQRRRV